MIIIKFLDKILRAEIKIRRKELEDKGMIYNKTELEKHWVTADWKGNQSTTTAASKRDTNAIVLDRKVREFNKIEKNKAKQIAYKELKSTTGLAKITNNETNRSKR